MKCQTCFWDIYASEKNISEVILPRVLKVQSFFFFFLHLISLPVLPNGPIRKVCAIISRVHCKEKTN